MLYSVPAALCYFLYSIVFVSAFQTLVLLQ